MCLFLDCKDLNDTCETWSEKGYCTGKFESYMAKNCKKSCNLCPKVAPKPGTVISFCQSGGNIGSGRVTCTSIDQYSKSSVLLFVHE